MDKIRLLLADDHNILRQGLVNIFSEYEDLCVIAEAENGEAMIKNYFSSRPDVVVTDIEMPGIGGIEAARRILEQDSNAKILFLTMHTGDEYVYKSLDVNAFGIVSKNILISELLHTIRTVATGGKYFLGKSADELNKIKIKFDDIKEKFLDSRSDTLTSTEKRILLLIAEGKTSLEIAEVLNKAKRTIDSIRSSIMSKLDLHSLPQLIRYAVQYAFFNRDGRKSTS